MIKRTAVIVICGLLALAAASGALLYAGGTAAETALPGDAALTPQPPEADEDRETLGRLAAFFEQWNANRLDDMLALTDADWQAAQENPKTELFRLLGNRTPLEFTVLEISGTEDDPERTVTVIALIDRNNGKDPARYLMRIVMKKGTDGLWYLDPVSLENREAYGENGTEEATPVPAALSMPAETRLYYVPDTGEYYHLDPECEKVNARYVPMENSFPAGLVTREPYAALKPCEACIKAEQE